MAPAVRLYSGLAALPPAAAALFARPDRDVFASRAWYQTLIAEGLPPDLSPLFAVCGEEGAPFALMPFAASADRRRLGSLTGPYTCGFRPLFAVPERARAAGLAIGRFCRHAAVIRLDAIAPEMPGLAEFTAGLRRAGLGVWPFDAFGNWYEPVAGRSFAAYLAVRPGALRTTIRRKMPHFEQAASFAVVTGGEELERAIADYEAVYARSWKEPEPFPRFNPALMRAMAALGLLRLGVLRLGRQPVALQLWVVSGGRAMVLKLAHDETLRRFSPGTVLTALMIEHLLGSEQIGELDFGRGDDPYKQLWTSERRQRIGLLLANPLRLRGLVETVRSAAGRTRRSARAIFARTRRR